MTAALIRKARQLVGDATLRRFMLDRALGRIAAPPPFTAHRPPYAAAMVPLGPAPSGLGEGLPDLDRQTPAGPLGLTVLGRSVTLPPEDPGALFDRVDDDLEVNLAVQRFAWLPLRPDVPPAWVDALWRCWLDRHPQPDQGWAWHPYTAGERAVNLLAFARRHGLPGPRARTLDSLGHHLRTIADRLEYFGDHHTSNHLANNGRGLYLAGLALGWEDAAALGLAILEAEARRIFLPSGVLREGSSHYHALLTRSYAEAWLAARRLGRAEAGRLEAIVRSALAALGGLGLPGGMPLVGDVSPDCPPAHLAGLLPGGGGGWVDGLFPEDREALAALRAKAGTDQAALAQDGWLRRQSGPWSGLWHAAPGGWSWMPGHGHQDCGAFEVHFDGVPLFVDPGRGAYGETGESALYRSAAVHNGLAVDGLDPYPPNRPYYDEAFRRRVGGAPPLLKADGAEVSVTFEGFARAGGVGAVTRRWRLEPRAMVVADRVDGRGRHLVERRLLTTWEVGRDGDGVLLHRDGRRLRLHAAGAAVTVEPATRWFAYGEGHPAALIRIGAEVGLPWSGDMRVEVD